MGLDQSCLDFSERIRKIRETITWFSRRSVFFFQNIYHVTLHSFFFILVYARLQFQQSAKVCLHALKTQNAQRDLGTAGKLQTSVLMTERSKDNIPLLEVQ